MNKDIESREDLEKLLESFYETVTVDEEVGHHFDELDLASHLPVIVDFWEKVIFQKPVYFGNPMMVHKMLDNKNRLETAHFKKWVALFVSTVDEMFVGSKADEIKLRAHSIGNNLNRNINGMDAASF